MACKLEYIETKTIHDILRESQRLLCDYVNKNSGNPFYRIKNTSYEHFFDLPLISKSDLLRDQKENPPFGSLANLNGVKRIHETSGSMGTPFTILLTEKDIRDNRITGGRSFKCAGLQTSDIVVHCLNYCLWAGGITDHMSLEETGAKVIPFGVGNSQRLIETILRLKPNCISCTPSYIPILEQIIKEMKILPCQLGLKKAFCGGEPFFNKNDQREIEEKWGMKLINANYGMSDVISVFGSECECHKGLHFHGQHILYPELINDKLESLPIENGVCGELVLTTLRKEAQPIIRFRTHDIIKISDHNKCECGRGSFKFYLEGRSDDMLIVKGVNVFPRSIRNIVRLFPCFTGRIVVCKNEDTHIPLKLYIELNKQDRISTIDVIPQIVEKCKSILSVSPEVFIREYQSNEFSIESKNKWVE